MHDLAQELEAREHRGVVAGDVAHQHVLEPHRLVAPQPGDDGVGGADQQAFVVEAAVAVGQDRVDVGAGVGVGGGEVDVASEDRPYGSAVGDGGPAVEIELFDELGVGGVLRGEPGVAQPPGAFDGDVVGAGDPDLGGVAGEWRDGGGLDGERAPAEP